jgi:hypothetical protein
MPHFTRRALAAAVCLLAVSACASRTASYPSGSAGDGAVTLEVRNGSQRDVEVHLDREGSRRRLGLVLRSTTSRYDLSGTNLPLSGRLRFSLNVLGSSASFVTEPVLVEGGETVVVLIGPDLEFTRVDVIR